MNYNHNKFKEFISLVDQNAPQEGPNYHIKEGFGAFKSSTIHCRNPEIDLPTVMIVAQGRKMCYVGDRTYDYSAGKVFVMFYPMAVEYEVIEANPETPFLVAGVLIDLGRLADVSLRIDRINGPATRPVAVDPSGIFPVPLDDNLLDAFIRLFKAIDNPCDTVILGNLIVDEIYYRLLSGERGGELRFLLQQGGEIQRIAKAVEYIHQNLDKPVSVEQLAEMVHMGQTSFYENFKKVMRLSPLQYAKSVKLNKAKTLIQEGKKANEAGYLVGYNSPAQFSREYKRHFGIVPSAT